MHYTRTSTRYSRRLSLWKARVCLWVHLKLQCERSFFFYLLLFRSFMCFFKVALESPCECLDRITSRSKVNGAHNISALRVSRAMTKQEMNIFDSCCIGFTSFAGELRECFLSLCGQGDFMMEKRKKHKTYSHGGRGLSILLRNKLGTFFYLTLYTTPLDGLYTFPANLPSS